MRLVTYQSMDAYKFLEEHGYLICYDKYIDKDKASVVYSWVVEHMNEIDNPYKASYPMWGWVKCYDDNEPKMVKGEKIEGFDVRIVFNKKDEDVLVTDYRRFSFLLNNTYIPNKLEDKLAFDKLLEDKNITQEELKAYVRKDKYETHRMDNDYLEICDKIRDSFDKCITCDSDVLQGCVWYISKDDIESIDIMNDDGYIHGSLNYKREDGKRHNWIEEFYSMLK